MGRKYFKDGLTLIVDELIRRGVTLQQARQEFERQFIEASLRSNSGNLDQSIRTFGVYRKTKARHLVAQGIEVMIPEDHRLTVEVPDTVRSGPARLLLVFPAEDEERTAKIDRRYAEIGELMAQSAAGHDLKEQIRECFRDLRELQQAEADALEVHFNARRGLWPGEGWRALKRAQRIIEDEDPTTRDQPSRPSDPATP